MSCDCARAAQFYDAIMRKISKPARQYVDGAHSPFSPGTVNLDLDLVNNVNSTHHTAITEAVLLRLHKKPSHQNEPPKPGEQAPPPPIAGVANSHAVSLALASSEGRG